MADNLTENKIDNIDNNDNVPEESEILTRFPGQREGEIVEFVLRSHILTLTMPFLAILFMAAIPMVFYALIIPMTLPAFLYKPYQDIYFLLTTIFYGFLWIIVFLEWSDYYLDIFLITNKRIMIIRQLGLFHRVVSELELSKIQDITSSVNGPLQTLFDFGSLEIQTASEDNKVEPKFIPHPVTVRRKIMELCDAAQKNG